MTDVLCVSFSIGFPQIRVPLARLDHESTPDEFINDHGEFAGFPGSKSDQLPLELLPS
jgi:hypothetical protein